MPESSTSSLEPRTQQSHGGRRFTILLMLALVAVPVAYEIPLETSRWTLASAMTQHEAGNLKEARRLALEAQSQAHDAPKILHSLAHFWVRLDDYEMALQACDRAIELLPDHPMYLTTRSNVYLHLSRFDDAIADSLRAAERSGRTVSSLNGLAYTRAVANVDLDEALADIETAVRQTINPGMNLLDTQGYIYYRVGKYEFAEMDMNDAIDAAEAVMVELNRGRVGDFQVRATFQEVVAILRYHRSLVYDALGKYEEADADRRRVVELGFEPNDKLF